jgi:superfamily II DNA or RNA helicase
MEVFGQKKNGNSQFFRVDGYKIYKRGSRDFFVKMREENYVYNIEVKGNNNYFVNGILLHNCYMAATFFKGVNFFQPKLRLGLTATPERHDGLSLSDLFDEITFEYNIADGIRDGYLVELDAIKVETNCSLDKVRTTAGDLNNKDLSNEINTLARNNLIADKWLKHAKGRKTIAFCCNIQHALDLCDAFLMKGISATAISSDEELTGDRTKKVKDFKDGKYEVIFNVNILTKGYDQPDVSCIIAAAPTKSKTRYMQAIGRGTRVLPGVIDNLETDVERWKAIKASDKKDCLILDIVDLTSKHNIVNTWTLDKGLDPEDRVFITQEKRELLLEHRRQKNSKLEHVQEKDERVKLLRIPKVVVVDSIKNREGATQKQLEWIYRLGYDQTAHYTKGMVAEILNKLPATKEDVQDLIKLGYDVDGKVITRGDVNAVRWEIQKKSKNKYK